MRFLLNQAEQPLIGRYRACTIRENCRGGGIGRHAGFRCLWGKTRGGSSPLLGKQMSPTLKSPF